MTLMGPALVQAAKTGTFDVPAWTAAENAAKARDFDQTVAAIAAQHDVYAALLADVSNDDFRGEIAIFGPPTSRGSFRFEIGERSLFHERPPLSQLGGVGSGGVIRSRMRFSGRIEGDGLVLRCADETIENIGAVSRLA